MPILGLLGTLLYFGCIFHAIKTGRINYWLMILIFLPGIGSAAYLLLEVLPEMRNSRAARLSRALFGRGDFQASLDTLDALQRDNPGYHSREAHMIYARSLEGLGRRQEAADEYRSLIGYALGPEAQVRYGLMMKAMGEPKLAEEAFRDAVKTYGRRLKKLDPADRDWIAEAERNLA